MQSKDRSFVFDRLDLNTSLVKEQNLLAKTQPDAAAILKKKKKRDEDPIPD